MQFTEEYISQRLHEALVGAAGLSDGYAEIDVTDETRLKCAAVLIPMIHEGDDWHILYTRRTDLVESHKGQVSFPGGGCDDGETTPEQTALREAQEEVGIDPGNVRILGKLANLITITSFRVTPVVGWIEPGFSLSPDPFEVAEVFEVPLTFLLDPSNHQHKSVVWEGRHRQYYAMPYQSRYIWGATAGMLRSLYHALAVPEKV